MCHYCKNASECLAGSTTKIFQLSGIHLLNPWNQSSDDVIKHDMFLKGKYNVNVTCYVCRLKKKGKNEKELHNLDNFHK